MLIKSKHDGYLLGGQRYLNGGGSSESSNSTATTNTDRRIANDGGLVLQGDANKFDASSNGNTINTTTNTTDGGAVGDAMDFATEGVKVVGKGFTDLIKGGTEIFTVQSDNSRKSFSSLLGSAEANNSRALDVGRDGLTRSYGAFESLVSSAGKMFDAGTKQNAIATESIGKAYQTATAEKSGAMDNKTMMVLGLAAAAVVGVIAFKK